MSVLRSKAAKFHTLDAMRGIAAMCIVVRHCPALFGKFVMPNSFMAVDLFFALSGFVLAHAYGERLTYELKPRGFMTIRLIRLFPLYLIGTIIGIVGVAAAVIQTHDRFAISARGLITNAPLALMMMPAVFGYAGPFLYPFNPPAWSLAFEIFGNAIYSAIMYYMNGRAAILVGWIIILTSAIWISVACFAQHGMSTGFQWSNIPSSIPRLGYSFTVGVFLYRLKPPKIRVKPWLLALSLTPLFVIAPPGAWNELYELVCILVIFPTLIWLGANVEPGGASIKIFNLLGLTSYGIYAIHKPVEDLLVGVISKILHIDLARYTPWVGIGFLFAIFGAVWIIDLRFDQPVRKWLQERFSKRCSAPT